VFLVQREHVETEVKSCGSDDWVRDCNGDADGGLFAFDASGKLGDGERNGMDDETRKCILSESAATFPVNNLSGPANAVGELDGADCRNVSFGLSMSRLCLAEDVLNGLSSPLIGDKNACVENQSDAEVSRGLRFRMISSMSAAKSGSSTAEYPRSFARASIIAIDSEIVRWGGAAGLTVAMGEEPDSITTSAPARTRAINPAKSRAASSSEM